MPDEDNEDQDGFATIAPNLCNYVCLSAYGFITRPIAMSYLS